MNRNDFNQIFFVEGCTLIFVGLLQLINFWYSLTRFIWVLALLILIASTGMVVYNVVLLRNKNISKKVVASYIFLNAMLILSILIRIKQIKS